MQSFDSQSNSIGIPISHTIPQGPEPIPGSDDLCYPHSYSHPKPDYKLMTEAQIRREIEINGFELEEETEEPILAIEDFEIQPPKYNSEPSTPQSSCAGRPVPPPGSPRLVFAPVSGNTGLAPRPHLGPSEKIHCILLS